MEGVTIETPRKEKLGTPGFLKSISKTILHKFSPKQFKRRLKSETRTEALDG